MSRAHPLTPRPRPLYLAAWLLAVGLFLSAVVTAAPAEAAEDPWLEESFDDGVSGVFDSGWGVEATADGHVGNGLVSRIPAGAHWGTSAWWKTATHLGSEPEEMWLRYYVKFPEGFRVDEPSRGKLPGFGGLYSQNCRGGRPSTTSAPCWSARMMFSPLYPNDGLPSSPYDEDEVTRIGFYPYLLSESGTGMSGQVMPWDADVATLRHGRWYCVEARVAMNTPGQADGVLEGYVDGSAAFEKTDAVFRRASESDIAVESLWFDVYYGGDATSPVDNSISFDSLAAGPERIGCNDNPDASGRFFDDDASVFEADIEQLAASGITKGCNPPDNSRFCPDDPVTRGQMAAFLDRALRTDDDPAPPPPPESPPDFWGMRSWSSYTDVIDSLDAAGAPLDAYLVEYPIDETSGDKDWLATGAQDNPTIWVPQQLQKIWDRGAVPWIQLTVDDLAGLASGAHDARVDRMLGAFDQFLDANSDARLVVDILPEANRRQKAYGDDPDRFRTAFRSLAAAARDRLGGERIRVAFSGHREMSSDRYSVYDHPAGGYPLWWPGDDVVDVVTVRGLADSAGVRPQSFFADAVSSMAATAGPDMPIVVMSAAPSDPDRAGQVTYLGAMADWAKDHPQLTGVVWDDVTASGLDYRLSADPVPANVDSASVATRTGGIAWLLSSEATQWRRARAAAQPFSDTLDSQFADSIRWLAATGVTKGCNPPQNSLFCPEDSVTRGQMAAFLVRALDLPAGGGTFADTSGHVFQADVAALAAAGITRGCNPPTNSRFCPDDPVTRGQMAAFLVRAGLTG